MPIFSALLERFFPQQSKPLFAKKTPLLKSLIYQLRDYFFLTFAVTFSTQIFKPHPRHSIQSMWKYTEIC
jgi:hypothetical protein